MSSAAQLRSAHQLGEHNDYGRQRCPVCKEQREKHRELLRNASHVGFLGVEISPEAKECIRKRLR